MTKSVLRTLGQVITRQLNQLPSCSYPMEVCSEECGKEIGTTVPEETEQLIDSTLKGNQQKTANTDTTRVRTMRALPLRHLRR